ncbi:MAG: RHS repeat protein, partial [Actinomycetia bacterium]|nr:RHS repeat protein [Actinomycetes bacterium]
MWQQIEFIIADFTLDDNPPNYNMFAAGDLGGVSLNRTANLLLQIDNIAGVTYDDRTGQLVLFGEEDVSLPEMDLNDMAVAVNSVYGSGDPGVSIDPPIQNGQMSVRYEGETSETEFGAIMFEADRVLKILSLGLDNLTGQSVSSSVPGYQNMLDRRVAAGCASLPDTTRMWFQPKDVRLVRSEDGQTMLFDEVSMELLYESKVGDQVVSDPQAAAFAQHFTDNYDLFAQEWPILADLEQLGKVVAVIKWIKDNNIPIDLSFINNYEIELFSTPTSTPVVSAQSTSGSCTITLTGGVSFTPPNEYVPDDPVDPATDAMRDEALGSRPSDTDFLWTFQAPESLTLGPGKGGGPLTAIAQSFTRSRKDGNTGLRETDLDYPTVGDFRLGLARYYDSFGDRPGPLNAGWQIAPYGLRFPVGKETFTFGDDNLTFELYARIWLTERPAEREDEYLLLGIDSDDLPLYARSGAMNLLRQQGDDTFLLTRVDGSRITFDPSGRLLAVTDANDNTLTYVYDAGDRLTRIEAPDGRDITLDYDGQDRLSQASGPGGRQITYVYDAGGNLQSVTDTASQTRTYTYDAEGRLTVATDAEGNPIFDGSYDDYDRTPSRRFGTAAEYNVDHDLQARSTRITDPMGGLTEQLFDEQYRLTGQTDPLGNRIQVTYDGDFGPDTITDARGGLTQLAYDVRGNLASVIDAEDGQTELYYDYLDRLVATRDAEGIETAFGYDEDNNLTTVYHTVQLQFDENGNLVSFLYDPDNLTTYTYDADGTLVGVTNPLDHTGTFAYDASGQLDSATSPTGLVTDYSYDARSRLSSATSGGSQIDLGYDGAD